MFITVSIKASDLVEAVALRDVMGYAEYYV